MAYLNRSNSTVDKCSGAIIFHGTPESQLLKKIITQLDRIECKLDMVLNKDGVPYEPRALEDRGFSSNTDP